MQARRLGRTGYDVTTLGVGYGGVASVPGSHVDPGAARRTLAMGIEAGLTFVDTDLLLHGGEAERIVGETVRELRARDRVVVATKVPPMNGGFPGLEDTYLPRVFAPAYLQHQVEASLRNTRLDALPLGQLHVWHDAWLDDETWPELRDTMKRMIFEGKVLHWGVACNDDGAGDTLRVLDDPLFETVQVIYNLFDRDAEKALFAKAAAVNAGVIVRAPLDHGALGGELAQGALFPLRDWRKVYFRGERLGEAALIVAKLARYVTEVPPGSAGNKTTRQLVADRGHVADPPARTVAELALRFCLSRPEVTVAVAGMTAPLHLFENLLAAAHGALPDDVVRQLAPVAWNKNWYRPEPEPVPVPAA